MRLPFAALLAMMALAGCAGNANQPLPEPPEDSATIQLTAPRFTNGSIVRPRYTCDGVNLSPDVSWVGVPKDAASLVLVLDDPDAPGGQFVHWLVYDLPPDLAGLIEGAGKPFETLSQGGKQARNSFGDLGYSGPCPPNGETHTYRLHIYALDEVLNGLPDRPSHSDLFLAMEGKIVGHEVVAMEYRRVTRSEENVVFR